jgi:hypothetical protein
VSISFPNHSRSYDSARRRVRFWGYDSALEITFFVEEDALTHLDAEGATDPREDRQSRIEAAVLHAFDRDWARVQEVAADVYKRDRGFTHLLTAADF